MPLLGATGTQLWRGCRSCRSWVPLVDQAFGEVVVAAVPGCHCWVPLVDQTFGEVVVAAVPGRHCGCRSWVPLLGGAPLLGAIGGSIGSDFWRGCCCCRSWVPLVGAIGTQLWRGCRSCHSWVPLLGAIGGSHFWRGWQPTARVAQTHVKSRA